MKWITRERSKIDRIACQPCYNRTRKHQTLGYVSPLQLEQRYGVS